MPKLRLHQIIGMVFFVSGVVLLGFWLFSGLEMAGSSIAIVFAIFLLVPVMFLSTLILSDSIIGILSTGWRYITEKGDRYERTPLPEMPSLPNAVKEWESELNDFGLHSFGGIRAIGKNRSAPNYTAWIYADESHTLFAELVIFISGQRGVEFTTEFPDNFILSTMYNARMEADSALVSARSFSTSISEAFNYHQYQTDLQSSQHGIPKQFQRIQDYINTKEYHRLYSRSLHKAILKRYLRHLVFYLPYILPIAVGTLLRYRFGLSLGTAVTLLMLSVVFWIQDFTKPPLVFQTMEQRKKHKTA